MPATLAAPPEDLGEFASLVPSEPSATQPDLGEFADLVPKSDAPLTEAAGEDLNKKVLASSGLPTADGSNDYKNSDDLGEFASLVPKPPAPETAKAALATPDTSFWHQATNTVREFAASAGQIIAQGIAGAMHAGAKALADEGVAAEPNPLLSKYGFTQDMAREQSVQTMDRAKVFQEAASQVAPALGVDPELANTIPARLGRAAGGTAVMAAEAMVPGFGVPLMAGHAGYAAYSAGLDMGQTEEEATRAGVATAIGMELFGGVNVAAAAGVAKILSKAAPEAGTLTKFIAQFAGQDVANELSLRALRATTAGLNAPEGEKLKQAVAAAGEFNLEDTVFNSLFAGIGAAHAASRSREPATSRVPPDASASVELPKAQAESTSTPPQTSDATSYSQPNEPPESHPLSETRLPEVPLAPSPETPPPSNIPVETPVEQTRSASLESDSVPRTSDALVPPDQPNEPATAPQDETTALSTLDKLKRVAAEAGPAESTGMGFHAVGNPVIETVARPWIDAAKGLANAAASAFRFHRIGPERDMVAAKFDAADNGAGMVARQARRAVELSGKGSQFKEFTPYVENLRQQAATFVRQSGGDKATMLAEMNAARGRGYDAIFDYAEKHWDELKPIADRALAQTDATYHEAQAAGVEFDYRQNYVKGAYDDPFKGKVIFDETGGGRGSGTSFKKEKVFDNYAQAIAAGFKPKELRLDLLTESAVNSTLRSVNRAKWTDSLGAMTMPDGRPIIEKPAPNGTAPRGYKMVQVTPGKLLPVHEEMEPTIRKLVDISHIPKLLSQAGAAVKHNILVFDIFHGMRFGKMQMAFERRLSPSYHKGLSILEYADRDLATAVAHKLISPEEAAFAQANRPKIESLIANGLNAGRISDALYKDVVPLMPGAKATNNFIFEKLSRGIITQSGLTALERNRALHPTWTDEKLTRYTAKEVNTYYRNLGNQGVFKSKTFQDLARMVFFAPQWIEGMVRSEARGIGQMAKLPVTGKLGNLGAGMGTGLVAYFALTQAINLITRGKPTWENDEPGHKLDAWIPDFIQGSGGFFMSPLSIFAETTHDALKYTERGMKPEDVASQLLSNKLHPNIRALWTLLHGTDFYGRPLEGLDREKVALENMAPIPLFARTGGYKGGMERQLASTLGEKITPAPSSANNIYGLAREFKKSHGLLTKDEESGVRHEGEYTDLTHAIQSGDEDRARAEYEKLIAQKKPWQVADYYDKYTRRAFTGSRMHERQFRQTLERGQLDLYNSALREREDTARTFRAWFQARK